MGELADRGDPATPGGAAAAGDAATAADSTSPADPAGASGQAPRPEEPAPAAAEPPATPVPSGTSPTATHDSLDAPPAALPYELMLTPGPDEDEGTLVPDQLSDAPEYVPSAMGMATGGIVPPIDPGHASTSAWITTRAPQALPFAGRWTAILAVLVLVIAVALLAFEAAGFLGLLPNNRGQVLFGTSRGGTGCSIGNATTQVTSTDPVFFVAVMKHHVEPGDSIALRITMGGQPFESYSEEPGAGFDCYRTNEALGTLKAGTYTFEVVRNGDVEASGQLTVTQ